MINRPNTRTAARAGLLLSLCVAPCLSGCNAFSAIISKFGENPTIPAKFTLKKVKTVVFCENFRNPDLLADDAELLARELQGKLDKKKAVPIVKAETIADLRNTRPKDFQAMGIPQIAAAVGAEQVIYLDLQGGAVGSMTGQDLFQGRATVAVRVIDAKTGATLFPPDSADGVYINSETDPIHGKDEGSYQNVRSELYESLALKVSHLFVPWKVDASEE